MSDKSLTNSQLLLQEIIRQEYTANNQFASQDMFFEFFAANQVLKRYMLSNEELENGLIGGGNDGGCDAVYVLLNDEVITADQVESLDCPKGSSLQFIIIQAKNTSRFGEDAIMKWKAVSENLLEMSNDINQYRDRYNEGVRDAFMLFRNAMTRLVTKQPKVSFKYYYVSLGVEIHPNVQAQAKELELVVRGKYPSAMISVECITADQLMLLYNSDPDINIVVTLADQAITLGKQNEYVTLINIAEYYKFITDSSGSLLKGIFESNVRDYQGSNAVNSSIAATLRNRDAEDFWWLNNGITVLSDKISLVTNKQLSISNPEVVNGLQTSMEIYNYFDEHKDELSRETRNVLVRFIAPDSEEARDRIIFANNNQTNIPKSSLRVTDPIHLQIEIYCKAKGLYYDRRKNYYKNQKKKATDIISVSFLAQCLISLLLRKPDFARARPSTLLTDDKTYNQLYSTQNDLSVYYKVGKLGKMVQDNLRRTPDWTSSEKNDILFYVLYGVVVSVLDKKDIRIKDIIQLDLANVTEELINSIKDLIYCKYKELGGDGSVAKSASFINDVDLTLECKRKDGQSV